MGVQRRKAVRWGALAAVLTVILSVAGIALGTTAPPTGGEMGADPELEAAGALTDPLPLRPSTTVAPVTTVAPRPSTSRPAPTTTVAEQVTPPVPVTTTTPGGEPSWSLDDKGISMRLWVEPAQPHVGDTVTLHFETWATVPTDFCCMNHLYVAGELIYSRLHDQGPCPLAPSTRHQRVTYVVTEPGPLALQLQANRVDLCTGFPQFTTNNLHASVVVSP
jgi:hypothetical protein